MKGFLNFTPVLISHNRYLLTACYTQDTLLGARKEKLRRDFQRILKTGTSVPQK